MALQAVLSDSKPLGYFRIYATPLGGDRREVTMFRNAPIVLTSVTWSDPFSDATAAIDLPQVTVFDTPGQGDLDWVAPDTDIDIIFENTGAAAIDWRWEGYIAAYSFSVTGGTTKFSLDLKGAFYGLDDYLAKPSFPSSPIPYEILIDRAFDQENYPTRLGKLQMEFPDWWNVTVPAFTDPNYASYLKPWGVQTGQLWTGFTSRSTGSWEPMLTGFVQSLLSVMFAEGGAQWTIKNLGHRTPLLYVREVLIPEDPNIIEVQLGAPGMDFDGSRDYTQRANIIYGQGTDDAGISYSGMTVAPDGKTTIYQPFAHAPEVYPRTGNPFFNSLQKPKEVMVRFQDGVDQLSARKIATAQYQRFSEPGVTGTITLTTDPRNAHGDVVPRLLIKAGTTFRIKGLFGNAEGVLAHATEVTVDMQNLTTTISIDTKYRDQLTVAEVKARTKDALTPLRTLQVGKYSNTVQDLLLPWSYQEGSGCVPQPSKDFFLGLPSTATFPYEQWTVAHPPSDPNYAKYYIRINPTNTTDSGKNWSGVSRNGAAILGYPIRMGQSGSIRLSQFAAYDANGHVLPVKFHVSIYDNQGIGPDFMPTFPVDPEPNNIPYLTPQGITVNYNVHQPNPFFKGAFESYNEDGTQPSDDSQLLAADAGLVVGWGNYYEPAGYYPGRFSKGAARTGMLVDDTSWTWSVDQYIDQYNPKNNTNDEYAGYLFVMIYCDDQGTQPVYFMGRLFREEPGVY